VVLPDPGGPITTCPNAILFIYFVLILLGGQEDGVKEYEDFVAPLGLGF